MSPHNKVLCTGRLYCDLVFAGMDGDLAAGRETYADSLDICAGGGAYITAAYLNALGTPAALAAMLPQEPFATSIAAEIKTSGVDMTPCHAAMPDDDPQITVAVAARGDRTFITRRAGPSCPPDMAGLLRGKTYRHLHIGELGTLVENPTLIEQARAAGMSISLDCSWDEEVFQHKNLRDLILSVDLFFPNESEYEALAHILDDIAEGQTLIATKLGVNGARVGTVSSKAKLAEVVDTTGAGDAFNAGFINAWLQKRSVEECLDAGINCGTCAVTRRGGATAAHSLRDLQKGSIIQDAIPNNT